MGSTAEAEDGVTATRGVPLLLQDGDTRLSMVPVVAIIPPALEMFPVTPIPGPGRVGQTKLSWNMPRPWGWDVWIPTPGLWGQQGQQWWLLQGSVLSAGLCWDQHSSALGSPHPEGNAA